MKFFFSLSKMGRSKTRVTIEATDGVAAYKYIEEHYPNWDIHCFWPVWMPKQQEHVPLPNSFTHPLPQFNTNLPIFPLTTA